MKNYNNLNGLFYLNNSGQKWVIYENGKKVKHTFKTKSGKEITRTAIYFESFGNFGSLVISYKGKKISVLADTILED
jgi:hypothetical protein